MSQASTNAVEVSITLNPEMDHLVITVGELTVGLAYQGGLALAGQLATALETMEAERGRRPRLK